MLQARREAKWGKNRAGVAMHLAIPQIPRKKQVFSFLEIVIHILFRNLFYFRNIMLLSNNYLDLVLVKASKLGEKVSAPRFWRAQRILK